MRSSKPSASHARLRLDALSGIRTPEWNSSIDRAAMQLHHAAAKSVMFHKLQRVTLRDSREERVPRAKQDRHHRHDQLIDEARVHRLTDQVATVDVDISIAGGLPGRGDELRDVSGDRPHGGCRGIERAVCGDQDGTIAVGPHPRSPSRRRRCAAP